MAKTMDQSHLAEPTKACLFLTFSHLDEDIASILDNLSCCKTKTKNNADLPNHHEAMTGEHSEEFKKAMDSELEGLVKRKTWLLVPRGNHKVILGAWHFASSANLMVLSTSSKLISVFTVTSKRNWIHHLKMNLIHLSSASLQFACCLLSHNNFSSRLFTLTSPTPLLKLIFQRLLVK